MAQFGDLIARLFGGGTRGLSGDADRVLIDDPELEYFNARLRRHVASDDLVEDPEVIWDGGQDNERGGLRQHLRQSEYGDNLGFTDVLVVLSTDDWHRTLQQLREPWTQRAAQILGEQLWSHCEQHDLHQIFPGRPFGFRFIEDGGHEMQGARLGLLRGEFVTGLLPNLYTGPAARSRPVISVLLNIPGEWEGYQEVGRLFSDQVQFTLGTHWLDTFSHPALRAPALYRLQQYADGSFVHIVNPDGKDKYRISSQETTEGPAVLTLSDDAGEAIAHMVLAIVDEGPQLMTMPETGGSPAAGSAVEAPAASPAADADASPADSPRGPEAPTVPGESTQTPAAATRAPRAANTGARAVSRQPAAPAAAPQPLGEFISTASRTFSHGGNRTVIPADVDERMLTLRERGALFQKVHFGRFMAGYDVYLGSNGELGTTIKERAGTFEIRGRSMAFAPHVDGITVDGRSVRPGDHIQLDGPHTITIAGQRLEFRDLRGVDAEGWPYLGEVRRNGGASHMVFGGTYRIGRDRRCKVRLPDETSNENIVWLPEMAQGGTIRSRNGEIPKSRFYTDSIMVASEHAEINLDREPVIISRARHCFTFIRRSGDIFALHPTKGRPGPQNLDLQPGDEILIGNCVFAVDYPPAEAPRPVPERSSMSAPRISPDVLARAAVGADGDRAGQDSGPVAMTDLPAAAGLGERGKAPAGLKLPKAGPDSFMGVDPVEPSVAPPSTSTGASGPSPARVGAAGLGPEGVGAAPRSAADPPDPGIAPPPVDVRTRGDLSKARPDRSSGPETWMSRQDPRVVQVLEDRWQLELTRPAALRIHGWMVSGEVTVGNHADCPVIIPENRSAPQQRFQLDDYFRIFIRGRRGRVELLAPDEAALLVDGEAVAFTDELSKARMEIIRRGPDGEEDFRVALEIRDEGRLPDPRARTLAIVDDDPMSEALFTQGLPLRQDRVLKLSGVVATAHWDGQTATLDDYLGSYQTSDGRFRPFFVHTDGAWRTAPEDGSPLTLVKGDQLIIEGVIYVLV